MTADVNPRLVSYDELGTYRHLLISERLRHRRRQQSTVGVTGFRGNPVVALQHRDGITRLV